MTPIQVVGIGLEGADGLTEAVRQRVEQATLLVGSDRHLSYFPDHPAERLILGDLHTALQTIRHRLTQFPVPQIVILVSGDPLFFGLGRLILAELPAQQVTFHPHLSSVQLAFNRIKVPWQDAQLVSVHGRSLDELLRVVQQGSEKIAVLTDTTNTPAAIARLLLSLELPMTYQWWVCENLGGIAERVQCFRTDELIGQDFEPLNVLILLRSPTASKSLESHSLPLLGLPDHLFLCFEDRPGLMTKREVRVLALGALALPSGLGQVVWDIGAGTGSVAVEIARLCQNSTVYAIEKTAVGIALIQQNRDRFQVDNLHPVQGTAPAILATLPDPDRIFIGGSGGNLAAILDCGASRLSPSGVIVLALATLEHTNLVLNWVREHSTWQHAVLQVNLSRSVALHALTRLHPLNPVTLITLYQSGYQSGDGNL